MADAAITTLNRKRGNIKSQITKVSKAVTGISLEVSELKAHLDIILRAQTKLEALKDDYYQLVTDDDYPQTEEALRQLDDEIQEIEVSLKTSINKIECDYSSDISSPSVNKNQPKKALMKLPKIPLPIFSGKFEEWNLFKTQFLTLIHDNNELSENEKLFYLRGSLREQAKIIQTSDDTYSSLFKALEQRYENKRIIVDCHIKGILNMQAIKHESAKDLQILLDNVKKNLRALKVLDFNRDKLSSAILLNVVLDKLDRETRKQFEITLKTNEVPSFDNFLNFWKDVKF